jgi:hypothetical protein
MGGVEREIDNAGNRGAMTEKITAAYGDAALHKKQWNYTKS